MTLFLAAFFLIYGGVHLYVFLRARRVLEFGRIAGNVAGVFMLLMTVSPIFVRTLEHGGFHGPAMVVAWPVYTWMGFLLLFFSASLFFDFCRLAFHLSERLFKKDIPLPAISVSRLFHISLVLACGATVYGFFEAASIRTERVGVQTSKLPEDVKKIKIAQISDLHLGLTVREDHVKKIIDILKEEAPDILVSTGDLVDGQGPRLDQLTGLFSEVNPKYGKYAVTGNHEFYAGLDHALALTEKAGFLVLRGSGVTVGGVFNIAGVDDEAGRRSGLFKEVDEKTLLSSLPEGLFTILLKHRPVVNGSSAGRVDLQLSGHTHKGQIFPFGLLVKLFYPNIAGLKEFPEGLRLYSSRGAGTWGPPIRFLSPPEVAIIEIMQEVP